MDDANRQIRINMGILQSILIKHTLGLTLNIASSPPFNVFLSKCFGQQSTRVLYYMVYSMFMAAEVNV